MSLRSIFKLYSAGVPLKLRCVSRGRPRILCPFSLEPWNTVLISDDMWHHKTTHDPKVHDLNSGSSSCNKFTTAFGDYLFSWSAGVGSVFYQLIQATGTPNGRNVFPRFYYITVACFLPQAGFTHMALFSPSWLPVTHYCTDNHHVLDTQETEPPDKLFTCCQTFEGAQISSFFPL